MLTYYLAVGAMVVSPGLIKRPISCVASGDGSYSSNHIARSRPVGCVASGAGSYSSEDWAGTPGAPPEADAGSQPPRSINRWQRIGECDVLLPEEGTPCVGLVHFVGGALVGAAPLQAYGPFLEAIGAGGGTGLGIVATPAQGLSGLDHWAAASEVLLRWCAAKRELDAALFVRGDPTSDTLPTIGLGHSLGCKLLVLLGSDAKMAEAIGPRAANVLVSYNNFAAARSIPLLEQAAQLGDAAKGGRLADVVGTAAATNAAGAIGTAGAVGAMLGQGAATALQGLSDSLGRGQWAPPDLGGAVLGRETASDALRKGLDATAQQLGAFGREAGTVGARARSSVGVGTGAGPAAGASADDAAAAPEFTPCPAETDALVSSSYTVGRNLLVRFADDDIDQSSGLARLLQARFTDAQTGLGGRLDFKKLEGTHVTPNAPSLASYLDGFDWQMANQLGVADAARALQETAGQAEGERRLACDVIVEFAEREARRAGM